MDKCYNHDYHDPCQPDRCHAPSPCPPPVPPCPPPVPPMYGCDKPTHHHHEDGCPHDPFAPCDKPDFCPPPFKPRPPMPPVPSVCEGQSLYEAMNVLTGRVNTCIETYNAVMAENYRTLHNLQRAAAENGAYYGPCEVWVEEGYYPDESATYHLIHKACVDRRGEPIRMELHLAYGNTTNSKIEQDIFSASKVTFADKIVVAQPKTDKGWYGRAIWKGCPIASSDSSDLYTVGFTRAGHMRVYQNSVSVDQMLRDTVENAMGCSGVLIQNGQLCEDSWLTSIPNYDQQTERVVMGQNRDTKEVIFLVCGDEDDVHRQGMTTKAAARILLSYGCDIAVELCEGADAGAMDKGSLMYVPPENKVPTAYCYWVISRRCFYRTDYERELAELIQNYGRCLWDGFLNKKRIEQVKAELDQEIKDRIAGDEKLQENIDKETAERKEADRILQENIDKEVARATSEEQRIETKLDEEIQRAKDEETRIEDKLDKEIERSTAEDKRLDDKIDKEIHDRANEDARLHQEILTEQGERIAADEVLQNNINQEAATRASEDTRISEEFQTKLDAETATRTKNDQRLQANIDAEIESRTNADSALGARIGAAVDRITACEGDILKLNELTVKLQSQMSSLDTTVTEILHTISDIESSLNNLKLSVNNLNTTVNKIIDGTIELPYVKTKGDTMTGPLNMADANGTVKGSLSATNGGVSLADADGSYVKVDGDVVEVGKNDGTPAKITNVAAGTENTDAVNFGQLADAGFLKYKKIENVQFTKESGAWRGNVVTWEGTSPAGDPTLANKVLTSELIPYGASVIAAVVNNAYYTVPGSSQKESYTKSLSVIQIGVINLWQAIPNGAEFTGNGGVQIQMAEFGAASLVAPNVYADITLIYSEKIPAFISVYEQGPQ